MRPFYAEGMIETDEGDKLALVCDFYTISIVEQISGENWDDIIPQLVSPPKALAVQVLYGLLRKRQGNITLDEAAGLSYDKNASAIWAVVGDVIARACNFSGGEEEAPKKKPSGQSKSSARNG